MLNEDDLLVVNIPPQEESIIKVIGVGGGGSNAVTTCAVRVFGA